MHFFFKFAISTWKFLLTTYLCVRFLTRQPKKWITLDISISFRICALYSPAQLSTNFYVQILSKQKVMTLFIFDFFPFWWDFGDILVEIFSFVNCQISIFKMLICSKNCLHVHRMTKLGQNVCKWVAGTILTIFRKIWSSGVLGWKWVENSKFQPKNRNFRPNPPIFNPKRQIVVENRSNFSENC